MWIFWAVICHIWWAPCTVCQLAEDKHIAWIKIIDKINGINSLNIFAFSFKFRFAFSWCFHFLLNISTSFCLLMNSLRNWLFGISGDPDKQKHRVRYENPIWWNWEQVAIKTNWQWRLYLVATTISRIILFIFARLSHWHGFICCMIFPWARIHYQLIATKRNEMLNQ